MKFDRKNLIFLGIFAAFFGVLFVTGEPVYTGDTFQYENQMVMREPVYALLFQFFRFLSPQRHYRWIIAFQNILAVIANTACIVFLRKRFRLNTGVSLLFTGILLAPHVMTPVFASTHLVLTNALMTEGLLFSIYPLGILSLMDAVWAMEPLGNKSFRTLAFSLFLSLIRGQMMVLFIVWFMTMAAVAFINEYKREKASGRRKMPHTIQQWLVLGSVLIMVFVARTQLVRAYNYLESGLFVDTASSKAMSFANVLYVAERSDAEAIEDETLRELFYEMYDAADADRMNYKYAGGGILSHALYHEQCHEPLNFTCFGEPAKRYVGETQGIYVDRYEELMIAVDEVAEKLSAQLMPQLFDRYLRNYAAVIALGFVRTVAYEHPLLVWYSLLIYLAAIALTVILWRKNPASKAAPFMAVVLLTIVGNVCGTALMIQCISRYMIYNLPLFYMAGFLELAELYKMRK